ncbi:MAG: hypothetical protein C0601_05040 [Candidatus Muiribacterium halophilum]|uniref:Uncharacterized protein n=1 Tax=Muiribacterium halophilum TaxID=2053465 RepID=A0A2N5ZI72_MUIH1|nr:MAG: hypothetical protein C0601_05040 [Candidatus Muirbacterium halophilum]
MKGGRAFFSGKKISLIQIFFAIFLILLMIYPALRLFVFPIEDVHYASKDIADHSRYLRNITEYIRWLGFDRLEITDSIRMKDYFERLSEKEDLFKNKIEILDTTTVEVIPVSEELKKVYIVDGNIRKEVFIYQR